MKDPAAHTRAALLLFAFVVILLVLLFVGLSLGAGELDVFGSRT